MECFKEYTKNEDVWDTPVHSVDHSVSGAIKLQCPTCRGMTVGIPSELDEDNDIRRAILYVFIRNIQYYGSTGCSNTRDFLFNLLLKYPYLATTETESFSPMLLAAKYGEVELMEKLKACGACVFKKHSYTNETPLQVLGADYYHKRYPLHVAVRRNNLFMVRMA